MAGVEVGDFGSPDETRTPDKTTVEIVRMGGTNASRMRLEPGWKWSECVKPVVGGVQSDDSGLKILVGYDVLVLVHPLQSAANVTAARSGFSLVIGVPPTCTKSARASGA